MNKQKILHFGSAIGILVLFFLGMRFLFPLVFPFLIGLGLAYAARTPVCRLAKKMPFSLASAIGVTGVLTVAIGAFLILGSAVLNWVQALELPDIQSGIDVLEGWLLNGISHAPKGLRPILEASVTRLFSDSSDFFQQAGNWIVESSADMVRKLPDSFLSIGTAILSAYMISVRWDKLRSLPTGINAVKNAVFGYLRAELILGGITFGILLIGLCLLRIPSAGLWAVLITVVDILPVLGAGTVLVPWSVVSLLQGQNARAIGLLGIFAVTFLSRSMLEPKLVGHQLGLDPLLTLLAIYVGFRLCGIGGMIVSPIFAVIFVQFLRNFPW